MIDSKKPILLSTGMNYINEIDEKVKFLNEMKCDFAIFQCTSQYPTTPENVGINFINEFINKYKVPVGLSDHTLGTTSAVLTIALVLRFLKTTLLSREAKVVQMQIFQWSLMN